MKLESTKLIFDNRPEPLSKRVREAMLSGLKYEADWLDGVISSDPLPELLHEIDIKLKSVINLPSDYRVLLTSSKFESINSAIKGVAWGIENERDQIAIVRGDQGGFAEAAIWCDRLGFKTVNLPLKSDGHAESDKWNRLISDRTAMIGISSVTPEVHVKRNLKDIVFQCRKNGVATVVDLSELCSVEIVDLEGACPDIVCIEGTAFSGPSGVAIMAVSPHIRFAPMIAGDLLQDGLRSGRINLSLLSGLSIGLDEHEERIDTHITKIFDTHELATRIVADSLPEANILILKNNIKTGLLIFIPEIEGEALVLALEGKNIFVTTGSSCSGSAGKPSQTLVEMGYSERDIAGAIHLAFRENHSEDDILKAISVITETVKDLWRMSGYKG